MTIEKVRRTAALRGMRFSGEKKFRNSWAGISYEIFSPDGRRFLQADTLDGIYRFVMEFPKRSGGLIKDDKYENKKSRIRTWVDKCK